MPLAYQDGVREQALYRLIKGFLFIPVCIALFGAALAILALSVDDLKLLTPLFEALGYESISVEGARSVLSTIAGAMMSVISLVYSLTLVVFTLAAGNISPRLLETFASNRTTQITIGLLGATFLYALFVLFVVDDGREVRVSVGFSVVLAAISFFWLVYFVNDVAGRIRVDAEIGRIQSSLRHSIDILLASEPREKPNDRDEIPDLPTTSVTAKRSGYVTLIDSDRLAGFARSCEGFVEVLVLPGTFVIEGMPIAEVRTADDKPDLKDLPQAFRIGKARAPEGDIQFSVHLMVEIALRALSPGINDSYTAISAIDHLSASFARILQRGAPSALLCDDDGTPRVWLNLLEVNDIVSGALRPLRQSARANVLVLDHLIQAIGKMAHVCRQEHLPLLKRQLLDIAMDASQALASKPDRAQIAQQLWSAHRIFLKRTH
ncbi:DUF2254 domain-containing protein [Roseibium sediminicola]|uniref:DUF2254 domain-containing protein n=1 Tax=Roseibium sediminicola TaxID=2933272 RepID=A0ABT0H078_9HYPH|nr:DUF2254 domain-containing protein [Roseibium sp. CAU 1639]MCK7615098.1 DUF2254 domain-containing protein [Roseibium sp. CAU 1639]